MIELSAMAKGPEILMPRSQNKTNEKKKEEACPETRGLAVAESELLLDFQSVRPEVLQCVVIEATYSFCDSP